MEFKTILVANYYLNKIGGTETFTYSMIKELKKKGFEVEYFTFCKGIVSDKIEKDLGVSFKSRSSYDLILANHNKCVEYLSKDGLTIQTCHGIFPELEQPSIYADGFVSISEEVSNHLIKKGFNSKIIWNGIDCVRFNNKASVNKSLKNVLSLSHSKSANKKITLACESLNLNLTIFNKHINPIWDIENYITKADLVIGLGRSAYDAMACGRAVLIYGERDYANSFADGYLNVSNIKNFIKNNCSGRFSKFKYDVEDIKSQMLKYNYKDGELNRNFALENLNIDFQLEQYLNFAKTITKKQSKYKLTYLNLKFKYNYFWYPKFKKKSRKLRHKRKKLLKF